ncbi:MAG: CBS domain-containing protein [Methanogenium sp.]
MTPRPISVTTDTPVSQVSLLMKKNRIGGIPVMENGRPVGIVTETDILSLLTTPGISTDLWLPSPFEVIEIPIRELMNWEKTKEALSDVGSLPISEVMSEDLVCTTPDAGIEEAASIMMKEGIARLIVVKDGEMVGIVTRADLVRGLGSRYGGVEE